MTYPPNDQWGPGQYPPPQGYPPAPYPPAPYQPGRQQGTNGLAIAALVLGIIGVTLLSIIFGFIALSQIKRTGQGGRGLAIAGLVISAVWVVGVVLLLVVGAAITPTSSSTGSTTSGGAVPSTILARPAPTTAMQVSQCVKDVNATEEAMEIQSLPIVPCTEPHAGEVFATFSAASGAYPGDAGFDTWFADCSERLAGYSPSAASDPDTSISVVYPTAAAWARGNRQVTCVAIERSGTTTTGSIRDR
ncbi:DUF4190 domain-containing protein [Pseudonocardia sp. TRM90224]|uniref:DUF4190 domain-containing protein n=1 Tax=Pseudonocardia sp. TRM90224 TaxID=2812678 RepID=UPI001E65BE1E|nr:DUF4190 domain-containing protein [Pseudonocardia sp. TRM90224]